jgi:hypothetical protein
LIESHKNINIKASGSVGIKAGGAVRFSAPALVRFNQMPAQRGRSGVPAFPESSFSYENETHMFAKQIDQRGLSRTVYPPFPSAAPKGPAKGGFPVKQKAKEEKKGFNWGGLLKAVVAVAVAVVAVATFGLGTGFVVAGVAFAALVLVKAAAGAVTAVADTAAVDAANGTDSGLGTYIKNMWIGAVTGAIPEPKPIAADLDVETLLRYRNKSIFESVKDGLYDTEEQLLGMFRSAENKALSTSKDNPVQTFETYKKEFKPDARDDEYIAAIYLMDKWGANAMGHAALGLLKGDGSMEVFSFAGNPNEKLEIIVGTPSKGQLIHSTDVDFDTVVYLGEEILMDNKFTNEKNEEEEREFEKYTNFIWIDVTNEQGMKMKAFTDTVDQKNPYYILYVTNCNYMAQRILAAGGLNFSETRGDLNDEKILFSFHGLIPDGSETVAEFLSYTIPGIPLQNKAEQFVEALVEDLEQGTIPRVVYDEATSTGHVPNMLVFGEITEKNEADEVPNKGGQKREKK